MITDYVNAAVSIRRELALEVSCTTEAVEELRGHLERLAALLQKKSYEAASAMGYHEISAGFIYLQRCLGGVEELHLDEQVLLKELARQRQCSESEAQQFLETEITAAPTPNL